MRSLRAMVSVMWVLLMVAGVARAESETAAGFTLMDSSGKSVSLSDFKGKVVYLDFWASWCSPCQDSFPWMDAMQKKYKDQGVEFVAINVDRKTKDAQAFLEKHPVTFTVVFDAKGETPKTYKLMGMPSAYVIDRNGVIRHSHIGFNHEDAASYEEHLTSVLQQK